MPDAHYENPRLAALYDLDSGWSHERAFYLALAGPPPQRILDLGCGTGLLCDAFAAIGHKVTGVEPASAMLGVAKQKPNAPAIEWVQACAQTYRSGERFDLIVMSGHAFQVLLRDDDIAAALRTMRAHLAPGGRIAFETRNPAFDWRSAWDYEVELHALGGMVRETRRLLEFDGTRMAFELRYDFGDTTLSSRSELRFLSLPEIGRALRAAGLKVCDLFGSWDKAPFDGALSQEMIFIVEHIATG